MRPSAKEYNSLRGPALNVLVMDLVREHHSTGTQVSTRQVAMQLGRSRHLNKDQLSTLYDRVRVVVRNLADAGLVQLKHDYHKVNRVNVVYISIPTPTPPPPCSA
jgi:hypothetical protein